LELDPLSVIINADVGTILFGARRYDESIDQLRKTVEMDPGFYYARWALGEAFEMKGRTKEAMAEYEKALALNHDDPLPMALLGRVYARTRRRDEALKILKQLQEASSAQGYVSPYNYALVYLGLGQKDDAIRSLEQTYE